jgi:L-alanine-DL-glutamate epimerase-like enolase superfamily enzyme
MKVVAIDTHRLRLPFVEPPATGFLPLTHRELLIVDVRLSSGHVGMGYLHPLIGGLKTLECCVQEMLAPRLLGETLVDAAGAPRVAELWRRLWAGTYIQGRMGITVMAQSALDIALWDAYGKVVGKPLWSLWGGNPQPLPIYGSGCFRGGGREGMIAKAEHFLSAGFRAIKMQVAHTFTPDQDVANVAAMRARLGPDAGIMGGENHFTHLDLAPFFASGRVPILQPDVMRGGYTDLFETARRAAPAGITIAPHLFHELMTHLLAAIDNPSWLEYMGWHDDLWIDPVPPVNGFVTPPDRPGHGLSPRPDLLDRYRV